MFNFFWDIKIFLLIKEEIENLKNIINKKNISNNNNNKNNEINIDTYNNL